VKEEIRPLIILGPTAAGKSALAVELALKLNGEVVSADSMQVYRGMDIGTAKPTREERKGVPHHLIDIKDPDESWTVSDFLERAHELTAELAYEWKTPVIAGGTGLYLWSLLEGFSFPITPADRELRAELDKEPASALYAKLLNIDPDAASKIHPNDKKRIVRALEVFKLTGKPISSLQKTGELAHGLMGARLIGLDLPRDLLYQRINERVDRMIGAGLLDEVKGLKEKGYGRELPSIKALGYKEVLDHLEGIFSESEMIEELKKRTRNFARRQMTWFRRFKEVRWYDACSPTLLSDIIKVS